MPRTCSSCGREVPERFRFCGFCGAPLQSGSPGSAGGSSPVEDRSARRLVTILFSDLTNFTRAASRADPEAIYLTIRRALERLAHPVKRLGGRIDRYIGDGFLATFGLPEAHEDDPIRAVLAALEMQDSMARLRQDASQSLGWDVQLRVGINSGVVISGLLSTGSLFDSTVYGHAVNVAKRLQEAARPGTVLVSEDVQRRAHSHFIFLQPVRLHLRGIEGQAVAYEVQGRRMQPGPGRGLSGRLTPLIGRLVESETLFGALRRLALERRGAVVLVTGEAGIGKSRLVEDTLGRLPPNTTIVRADCSPTEPGSYALLTAALESLAGITPDMAPETRQERLESLLTVSDALGRDPKTAAGHEASDGPGPSSLGAALHGLLGGRGLEERIAGDPQQQRNAIYAAVRQLLAAVARRRPLVLVMDDVQWADPSSLEVLAHVADLVRETPMALLAISRTPVPAHLPAVLTAADPAFPGAFTALHLSGLSPEESESLAVMLLSEVDLPAALRRSIAQRTGGNPLLVEEMVRMLLDHQVIKQTSHGWQVEAYWPDAIRHVPDTVNGLILSRYDRLSSWLKKVLDSAAVLGQSFRVSLLSEMTGVDEPRLRPMLVSLEEADFIRRSSGAGRPVYFFRHALLQEAIYETILQRERRLLHEMAAQAIQSQADPAALDLAGLVGHHLERAQSGEAARFLMQAAAQAADRFANHEAVAYYRRVETVFAEHGSPQEQAVDVALGLSEVLARLNRLDEALEQLERARSLSVEGREPGFRRGDVAYRLGLVHALQGAHAEALEALQAAAAALEADPEQCRSFIRSDIEREIGWIMCDQANLPEAQRRAERALTLAREQGDRAAAGSAHNLLAAVHYFGGNLAASVESALEALAIREQAGDVWGSASIQSNLGLLYHRLGKWTQAEAYLRQAIFVQQEIGDYNGLGLSLNTLGELLLDWGRYDEAMQGLNQAIAALRDESEPPSLACPLFLNSGLLRLRLADLEAAIDYLQRGLEAANHLNNDNLRAWALALLAEAQLAHGDPAAALALIQEATAVSQERGSPEARAEIHRVQSRLYAAEKRWWPALEASRKALELYRQIGHRYQIACRQVDAAEFLLGWHEHDLTVLLDAAVWNQLVEALRLFRDLRADPDILRAEDILIKFNSRLGPASVAALRHGQQPVVVVHLKLPGPAVNGGDAPKEGAAETVTALSAALDKVGRELGAAVTASQSGLCYVIASVEPEGADGAALKAIQCAQAAVEASLRHGQTSRRRFGLEVPVGVGIAAGRWQESAQDPEKVAVFASVSQTGRQAAAAAALAKANQIVLTSQAARPARAIFELDALEDPKDARLPEPVYRLGRARPAASVPRALPASSPELVGRNAELAALNGWMGVLRPDAAGRVCYMEAEAGMGKTRLLEEVLAAAPSHIVCLHGKCESFRSEISFWPLVDMLEHSAAARDGLPTSQPRGLRAELPAGRRLKSLLGLRPPSDAEEALLHSLPPASLRPELFACVREFLMEASAAGHCLLVVEDIHWLDLTTLDLLDNLLPLTLQSPISILLVARAEMPGPHRALVSKAERICQSRFLSIRFSGLDENDGRALVHSLLGTADLPPALWDLLQPFAGHPLSVEEALRYLVERGWLWEADGRWSLAEVGQAHGWRMPTAFRDLLLGRLEALDSETLHVLQAAAVLGEAFSRAILGRIVPGPALSGRLTELSERGWLNGLQPESSSEGRFKHTLTRETIYATLLASKRQVLHQRAGEAYETLYPEAEAENLELLAYHFGNTGLRDKALQYLVRAAEKSAARYALAESLGYFQRARELLDDQPSHQAQLMPTVALGLADAHLALGEPAAVAADLAGLLEAEEQRGDRGIARQAKGSDGAAVQRGDSLREGASRLRVPGGSGARAFGVEREAAQSGAELRAACLRRLGMALRRMGEFQPALNKLQVALAAWQEADGSQTAPDRAASEQLMIELEIAQTLFAMRENETARAQADQVLKRIDRVRQPELAADTLNLLGGIAYREIDPEGSARLVHQSLAIYQADGNRSGAASAYANLGLLAAVRQELDSAHDYLTLSLAIQEALGNVNGMAVTRNNLGLLARNRGAYSDAIHYLTTAVEAARHAELSPLLAQGLSNLGDVQRLMGLTEKSLASLDEAEALCRTNDYSDVLCEVLCKRADCLLDDNCLEGAETAAGSAVAMAEELESDDLLSDARRALARACRRLGRIDEALEAASSAWAARSEEPDAGIRARFAAEYALALEAAGRVAEAAGLLAEIGESGWLRESPAAQSEIGDAFYRVRQATTQPI